MLLDRDFFNGVLRMREALNEALRIWKTIAERETTCKNSYVYPDTRYQAITVRFPEFTKHMVWVKKHVRPPVRAEPDIRFYPKSF